MADNKNDLDFNDDDEFDFSEFDMSEDSQAEPPPSNPREAATRSLKEGAKGFLDDFTDDKLETGLDIAKAAIPNSLSKETAVVSEISDNLKEDFTKAGKEVKTKARQTLNAVEKFLPKNDKVDSLVSKVKNFLGEESSSDTGPSKEQLETEKIEQNLTDALGAKSDRENMEKLINDQIEANRHKSNVELLSIVASNTESSRKFNQEVSGNYFRTSLELQYRQLYTSKEQLTVLKGGVDTFKNQLESIVKNTSLPDIIKTKNSEVFKANLKRKMIDESQAALFKNNSLVKTVRDNVNTIIDNTKDKILGGLSGIEGLGDVAGGAADMDMPGMSKGSMAGSLVAGIAKTKLGKIISDKMESNDFIKDKIFDAKNRFTDVSASLKDGAKKFEGKEGVLNNLAANALNTIGDITDTKRDSINSVSIDKTDLSEPVLFDGRAHSSLTKIIPGLLSKIHSEVKSLRTGEDPKNTELVFDHDKGTFTEKKDLISNFKEDLTGNITKKSGILLDQFIDLLKEEGGLISGTANEERKLRKGIIEYAMSDKPFTPNKLIENGFADMFPGVTGKKITLAVNKTMQRARKEPNIVNTMADTMNSIRESIPDVQRSVSELNDSGNLDVLKDNNLIKYDEDNKSYSMNDTEYRKLILDAAHDIENSRLDRHKTKFREKEEAKKESTFKDFLENDLGIDVTGYQNVAKKKYDSASTSIKKQFDNLKNTDTAKDLKSKVESKFDEVKNNDKVQSVVKNEHTQKAFKAANKTVNKAKNYSKEDLVKDTNNIYNNTKNYVKNDLSNDVSKNYNASKNYVQNDLNNDIVKKYNTAKNYVQNDLKNYVSKNYDASKNYVSNDIVKKYNTAKNYVQNDLNNDIVKKYNTSKSYVKNDLHTKYDTVKNVVQNDIVKNYDVVKNDLKNDLHTKYDTVKNVVQNDVVKKYNTAKNYVNNNVSKNYDTAKNYMQNDVVKNYDTVKSYLQNNLSTDVNKKYDASKNYVKNDVIKKYDQSKNYIQNDLKNDFTKQKEQAQEYIDNFDANKVYQDSKQKVTDKFNSFKTYSKGIQDLDIPKIDKDKLLESLHDNISKIKKWDEDSALKLAKWYEDKTGEVLPISDSPGLNLGIKEFMKGGHTGGGNPKEEAGVVHKEEYILNKEDLDDLLSSVKSVDFKGIKDSLFDIAKGVKENTKDNTLRKTADTIISNASDTYDNTIKEQGLTNKSGKLDLSKVKKRVVNLSEEAIDALSDKFYASEAYRTGTVKTFEEYVNSLNLDIQNFDFNNPISKDYLYNKKQDLLKEANEAKDFLKERLDPNLRTITQEEEEVLEEEFYKSDAYRKGYVTQFKEWLHSKGLRLPLNIKKRVKDLLKKTRALDRKIMGSIPKAIVGAGKLTGKAIRIGGGGLLDVAKGAATGVGMAGESVLKQLTGYDVIKEKLTGKKDDSFLGKTRAMERNAPSTVKDKLTSAITGLTTFMKNFKDEKVEPKKKEKDKKNIFDKDGDGTRDGSWKEIIKEDESKDKKGKSSFKDKLKNFGKKITKSKFLSTTGILLMVAGSLKAMGVTMSDVKDFTKGFVEGLGTIKDILVGIYKTVSTVVKTIIDLGASIKDAFKDAFKSIKSFLPKMPKGISSWFGWDDKKEEKEDNSKPDSPSISKRISSWFNSGDKKEDNPKPDILKTQEGSEEVSDGKALGNVAAYTAAGALAYKPAKIAYKAGKAGFNTVKGAVNVVKGTAKAINNTVKTVSKVSGAVGKSIKEAAPDKVLKKAPKAKMAKIAKKIPTSKIKLFLGKIKKKLIKKLGRKAATSLLGKVASRFVPFMGTALLAYDAAKIGYDMVVNGTDFGSAVSKQILGFDIFDDNEPAINDNGEPIKPDISNTVNSNTTKDVDTTITNTNNITNNHTSKNSKRTFNSGDILRNTLNKDNKVNLTDVVNNTHYAPTKPITKSDILDTIKGDYGYNKGKLLSDLVRDEGLSNYKYKDSLGYDTIGVGHLVDPNKGIPLKKILGVDKDEVSTNEAYKVLAYDVNRTSKDLYKKAPWIENQPENIQRDLNNMAFNLGTNGLMKFKKGMDNTEDGNYTKAAKEFMDSKWFKQVGPRAERIVKDFADTQNQIPVDSEGIGLNRKAVNNIVKDNIELSKLTTVDIDTPNSTDTNSKPIKTIDDDKVRTQQTNALLNHSGESNKLAKLANDKLSGIHSTLNNSLTVQQDMLKVMTTISEQNKELLKGKDKPEPVNNTTTSHGKSIDKLKEAFPQEAVSLRRASF